MGTQLQSILHSFNGGKGKKVVKFDGLLSYFEKQIEMHSTDNT